LTIYVIITVSAEIEAALEGRKGAGLAMVETSELAVYRKRLEDEKKRLLAEIAEMNTRIAEDSSSSEEEAGGVGNHMADDASDTFEQEKYLALKGNIERLLALVDRALKKVDDGTYGFCERCGQPIDPERLQALPYATLDVRCKTLEERGR
jgi:DnaK suppressor protein